ncbi:MAG: YraN family protein [Acidimicrobiia bacterium]
MSVRRLRLGARGEAAVAQWYEAAGYRILARNWRCREGEIDLVASRGPTLAVCEVKTRTTSAYGLPAEAVTVAKQRRLRRLAARWLAESAGENRGRFHAELRFDVACVSVVPTGLSVEVIEAAF